MKEFVQEILSSIRHNKLRTALTGFSVAWGIFLLMILMGFGNGLQNGVMDNFKGMDINTITIYPGHTTMPFKGYEKGRKINLTLEDAEFIKSNIKNIADFSAIAYGKQSTIKLGKNSINGYTRGITPNYITANNLKIKRGRDFTKLDIKYYRKTLIINQYTADVLFEKGENPIGKKLEINGIIFTVIAVAFERYPSQTSMLYIPISTINTLYSDIADNGLGQVILQTKGVNNTFQSKNLTAIIKKLLATRLDFDPNDKVIYSYSNFDSFQETQDIFGYIKIFLWIIGQGTLIIGIIGVSNIMIVTVKERTFEFGIRKSMGATPASLIKLVLAESIIITTIFGYIGLLLGTIVTRLAGGFVEDYIANAPQNDIINNLNIFKDPHVDINTAIIATVVLIVAGVIAGYIPARRAARLKTIDAMRYNK